MKFLWSLVILIFCIQFLTIAESSQENANIKTKRQLSALPAIENCKRLREECLKSCKTITNCTEHCPICPILTKVDPIVVTPSSSESLIHRNIIVEGLNGTSRTYNVKHIPGANYTTVIRLSNIINNTNVVKIPTILNSTNINNINLFANSSETGGIYGMGVNNQSEPCCFAIHPKRCRYLKNGFRCHHRRHKTCGSQCTSRIIHIHSRDNEHCEGANCRKKLSYIPEPRPSCFYTNYWPYVNCPGSRRRSCAGCYDHYGYGYSSYHSMYAEGDCSGCYDDGFEYGQLYRRGPVLRPFYYHEPPCYITGQCQYSGYYENEFGYYGHDRVDPATGHINIRSGIFEDDTNDEDTNNTISDWGVVLNKCKVISNNSTVHIENCTVSKENPFAATPSDSLPYFQPMLPAPNFYKRMPEIYYNQDRVPIQKSKKKNQKKHVRRMTRRIRKHNNGN